MGKDLDMGLDGVTRHHSLWADQRLAEAYDLVAEVVAHHATAEDSLRDVAVLKAEILKTDDLLAGILHDRRAA